MIKTNPTGMRGHKRELRAFLLAGSAGLSAFVLAAAAHAQAQDMAPLGDMAPAGEAATLPKASPSTGQTQDIVVTGSRIVRRDYTATSPIVTVDAALIEKSSSVSLEANLNKLPQFAPALTQFNSDNIQSSANTTLGASTVSLRQLGSNRNLVLIDGRRGTPINGTGVIDINTIPSAAIARVEIITGGASSTYGADAVGGVVNFILKKNYQGLEMDGQYAISEHGDGKEWRVTGITGANFSDGKGNVLFGVEHYERGEVLRKDRQVYRDLWSSKQTGGTNLFLTDNYFSPDFANLPSQAAVNGIFGPKGAGTVPGNQISPSTGSFYFNNNDSLFVNTTLPATATSAYVPQLIGYQDGTDGLARKITAAGTLAENNTQEVASIPQNRWSMFGKAHFDFNDNISFFTQGYLAKTSTISVSQYAPAVSGWGTLIPHGTDIYTGNSALNIPSSINADGTTNVAYLAGGRFGLSCPATGGCTNSQVYPVSPELNTLLNSRANPNAPWTLNQFLTQLGTRSTRNNNLSFQILSGFNGQIPGTKDWTYEVFGSHGETVAKTDQLGFGSVQRWRAVVSSPNFGKGFNATGNAGTPGNGFEGANATCTSGVSPFAQDMPWTQDCINAVNTVTQNENRVKQTMAEADVQGGLFKLPYGTVRVAAGLDYRKNSIAFDSDSSATQGTSFLEGVIGIFPQGNTRGSTETKEIYAEALIPLLADLPFAKAVNIEAGYRRSKYSGLSSVGTYKLNGEWRITDWIGFRGGYQKASRAPNLGELFTAPTQTLDVAFEGDPCSQRNPSIPSGGIGNYSATAPGTVVNGVAVAGNVNGAAGAAKVQALCKQIMTSAAGAYYYDPTHLTSQSSGTFGFAFVSLVGNPNLKPENAQTYTIGTVMRSPFSSPWLVQFRATVDYYNVHLTNAISQQGQDGVYRRCFSTAFNPTLTLNNFCGLIQRDPTTGAASTVGITYSNGGEVKTDGIDGQINWGLTFKDAGIPIPGSFSVNVLVNYLNHFKTTTDAGIIPLVDQAGTLGGGAVGTDAGAYRWKAFTTFGYAVGPATFSLQWRHLPATKNAAAATIPNTPISGAPNYDIFDLSGTVSVSRAISLRWGVDNLFNKAPPITGVDPTQVLPNLQGGSVSPGYYDILGRRFYVGAKLKF